MSHRNNALLLQQGGGHAAKVEKQLLSNHCGHHTDLKSVIFFDSSRTQPRGVLGQFLVGTGLDCVSVARPVHHHRACHARRGAEVDVTGRHGRDGDGWVGGDLGWHGGWWSAVSGGGGVARAHVCTFAHVAAPCVDVARAPQTLTHVRCRSTARGRHVHTAYMYAFENVAAPRVCVMGTAHTKQAAASTWER